MSKLRKNVTYLIDANNYVCKKYGVVPPPCDYSNDFLEKIDRWLEREIEENNRRPEVYTVFDSGAKNCILTSKYAQIIVTLDGVKADSVILKKAHEIRETNQKRVVRIISDEKDNEFAILRKEGFEQQANDYLAAKINLKVDKENIDLGDMEELRFLFGMADQDYLEEERKENLDYHELVPYLDDKSPQTRLAAVKALQNFPNDFVILSLKKLIEKEQESEVVKCALDVLWRISLKHEISEICQQHLLGVALRIWNNETDKSVKMRAGLLLYQLAT